MPFGDVYFHAGLTLRMLSLSVRAAGGEHRLGEAPAEDARQAGGRPAEELAALGPSCHCAGLRRAQHPGGPPAAGDCCRHSHCCPQVSHFTLHNARDSHALHCLAASHSCCSMEVRLWPRAADCQLASYEGFAQCPELSSGSVRHWGERDVPLLWHD